MSDVHSKAEIAKKFHELRLAQANGGAKPNEPQRLRPPAERARTLAGAPIPQRLAPGMPTLDRCTRRGFPVGRRVVLAGAPGACKTTLAVQWAHAWATAGASVVILAADQDCDGSLVRMGGREGLHRDDLDGIEGKEPYRLAWSELAVRLDAMPNLQVADGEDVTLEQANAHLLAMASPRVLVVDSIQKVRCERAMAASSPREAIDLAGNALRAIAQRGVLIVATSEVARGMYRDPAHQTSALASAKESGSIEYAADVLIGLRSVQGEPDLVDAELAKCRLGRCENWRMQLDRRRAALVEIDSPPVLNDAAAREERNAEAGHARNRRVAIAIVRAVLKAPGNLAIRDLEALVRSELGSASRSTIDAARKLLGDSLVRLGTATNAGLWLNGERLPDWSLASLGAEERARAGLSRPPDSEVL